MSDIEVVLVALLVLTGAFSAWQFSLTRRQFNLLDDMEKHCIRQYREIRYLQGKLRQNGVEWDNREWIYEDR